jgi:glycosyltransferase involved in cell wall biosynthesis
MKNVKISVIIPTLNEEKYIGSTLFHVASQKPYEIIIGDSHSTDRTAAIAKKYGCKVVNAPRGSPSIGRNAAAKVAKGDVLLFVDADTIAFPNLLDTVRKDFAAPRTVGWTCNIFAFSPKWKEHLIYNANNNLMEFLIKLAKKPHAPGIVFAVRNSVFKELGGFDEKLKVMEDHDLAFRVGKKGTFIFSTKTCVYTSTRRMNKWGGWGLIKKYSKYYVSYFTNKKKLYHDIGSPVQYEEIR